MTITSSDQQSPCCATRIGGHSLFLKNLRNQGTDNTRKRETISKQNGSSAFSIRGWGLGMKQKGLGRSQG